MHNFFKYFKQLKFISSLLKINIVTLIITISNSNNLYAGTNININTSVNFYVGASVGYNKYLIGNKLKEMVQSAQGLCKSHSFNLLTPMLAVEFDNQYGVEFGYGIYGDLKFSDPNNGYLELRNYFLDFTKLIPAPGVLKEEIDLVLGAGIGKMYIKENRSYSTIGNSMNYNKYGFRIKGGVQYPLDESWNIRGLLSYQRVGARGYNDLIKTMRSFSLELLYIVS